MIFLKIKNFIKTLGAFLIVAVAIVGYAMVKDYQAEREANNVAKTISEEADSLEREIQSIIDSTVVVKQEELPESLQDSEINTGDNSDSVNVSDIVSGAIDKSTEDGEEMIDYEPGFSNMEAVSSDTFNCVYNGQETTFRLIGVKSNGDAQGLQGLLDNAENLTVEYDTVKKNSDGAHLIYLWDGGQDNDCLNMINVKMILNSYAGTTYANTSDSTSETPNIKYSTKFIKYQKLVQ